MQTSCMRPPAKFLLPFVLAWSPLWANADDYEPLYVDLHLQAGPTSMPGCEGGDWSLSWTGSLPAEGDNIQDLLASYSSFDSTHRDDWPHPAPRFNASPLVCYDDDGKVITRATLGSGGEKLVRGLLMLRPDGSGTSPGFSFSVDDLGDCRISMYGQSLDLPGVMLGVQTGMLAHASPAIELTADDLEQGFTKRYQLSGTVQTAALQCINTELADGSHVVLRYKAGPNDPSVKLEGCVVLPKGANATITAQGDPSGGSYRFSGDSSNIFDVQPWNNQATVTGSTPGRGTIQVEYSVNGKTATASLEGGVVELISVNRGEPLPKLGLYDVQGKLSSRVYSFDLQVEPADGGSMLSFRAENEALANVLTGSSTLQLQPVRVGKSRLQAQISCGFPVGDPFPFEVVPCDDEVMEELTQQEAQLIRRQQELVKRITRMTADPEFDRAGREVAANTQNMAIKLGETIAAVLTLGEAAAAKNAGAAAEVVRNAKHLSVASDVWSGYGIVKDGFEGKALSAGVSAWVLASRSAVRSLIKTVVEATWAAEQLGQDLGTLVGFAEELAALEAHHKPIQQDLDRVWRVLKQCRVADTQSDPPATETPPSADQPDSSRPSEPASEIPQEPEIIEVDEQMQEPTPEPQEPATREPKRNSWGGACVVAETDAARAAGNLREFGARISQAQAEVVKPMQDNLERLDQWYQQLDETAQMPIGEERNQRFRQLYEELEDLFQRLAANGRAAQGYEPIPPHCPEVLDTQVLDFRTLKWKLGP